MVREVYRVRPKMEEAVLRRASSKPLRTWRIRQLWVFSGG